MALVYKVHLQGDDHHSHTTIPTYAPAGEISANYNLQLHLV